MKFGVGIPNYGETLSVEAMRRVAVEAEKLGYDSIWTTDHILMPRNSGTPYERIFDSIVSLAYLAPQTTRVGLGISSLIVAMRNPAAVAKQLASIDTFSGGRRVLLAMASGWSEREFQFVGSNFHTRGKRIDESIRMIRALWRGETTFKSKIIPNDFADAVFEPRPASRDLTIWIGGVSEAAMKRAADLGDAWHPNVLPMDKFRDLVVQFRKVSTNAKSKDICVRIALNSKATQSEFIGTGGEKRILLSGNTSKNIEIIGELEKLGVTTAVVVTSPDGKVGMEDQIESIRSFAREFVEH